MAELWGAVARAIGFSVRAKLQQPTLEERRLSQVYSSTVLGAGVTLDT